jgi:hypothetical protein
MTLYAILKFVHILAAITVLIIFLMVAQPALWG